MHQSRPFRRLLLLLLSLTLSAQAMAVASLGGCHQAKTVASTHGDVAAAHRHHDATLDHPAEETDHSKHSQHGAVAAHGGDADERSTQEGSRVKCAACAACQLCSVLLTAEIVLADIPAGETVSFLQSEVPRLRNVANGLERPPRA
jgi:hypothetical protein